MVLQYFTGKEDHYRCVKSVLGWCYNISQGRKIIINTSRVYEDGASISHWVKDKYRCVKGVLGYCFNISQVRRSL